MRKTIFSVLVLLFWLILQRVGIQTELGLAWILALAWYEDRQRLLLLVFVAGIIIDLVLSQPVGLISLGMIVVVTIFHYLRWRFESSLSMLIFGYAAGGGLLSYLLASQYVYLSSALSTSVSLGVMILVLDRIDWKPKGIQVSSRM